MIARWIGRLFVAWGRLRDDEAARDLAHVGEELLRLERRAPQRPGTSSR